MSKGKLAKFADMASYPHVFEFPIKQLVQAQGCDNGASPYQSFNASTYHCPMRGKWNELFFKNSNPIVLELGCGRGEYAVGLARRYPDRNFIGVDIKGSRMWTGATQALEEGLPNVAFLRTNIEVIDLFFAPGEVSEIWLTFSDPQMKKVTKRLTSTFFLERYRHFLRPDGIIHLKTDSPFLFTYTKAMAEHNALPIEVWTEDLYGPTPLPSLAEGEWGGSFDLSIRTYYEQQWLSRGMTIKYIRFHLPSEGPLTEPEVEIELDDYRSYNREKRSSLTVSK